MLVFAFGVFLKNNFIGGYLIYNVPLVYSVQRSGPAMHIPTLFSFLLDAAITGALSSCLCCVVCHTQWCAKVSWGGRGDPLQHSCLMNAMDGGTWQATVPRIMQS